MERPAIYVVDDEESIRLFLKEELTDDGYEVTVFPDLEAARHLLKLRPDLPVVLCSAYSDYKHDFGAWSADGYFVKSAQLQGLKEMIRRLLGENGSQPDKQE